MKLEVRDLSVSYGAIPALRGINFALEHGHTLAVVGANGAGKSTLALAIAGALRPVAGQVFIDGLGIIGLAPEAIALAGVALVPEGRHIFDGLTVAENLELGTTANASRAAGRARLAEMYQRFPILAERRRGLGTLLSGGEQQQLAIARALVSDPELLILDEPSLGLSPVMIDLIYDTLAELKAQGLTILLIEQNAARIGRIADDFILLKGGTVQHSGTLDEVAGPGRLLDMGYLDPVSP